MRSRSTIITCSVKKLLQHSLVQGPFVETACPGRNGVAAEAVKRPPALHHDLTAATPRATAARRRSDRPLGQECEFRISEAAGASQLESVSGRRRS